MSSLLFWPFLAGLALALQAGPVGCFVSWRRMAFYGDALSHAALLGIALGLLSGIGANWGAAALAGAVSLLLILVQRQRHLAQDTWLAILAHGALAGGIALIYLHPELQVNLYGYLFGDILSVGDTDAAVAFATAVVILGILAIFWRKLLLMTLHEDLAQAEGMRILPLQAIIMLLIACCVAVGVHLAGVLLMSSLLVIPSAAARGLARSPVAMVILASLFGMTGVGVGMLLSFRFDLPTGPAIVLALVAGFLILFPFSAWRVRQHAS